MYESQNKWCFVPGCRNTSISAPNKTFISVPQNSSRKVKWFKAARRDVPKSKSTFFCCEDHFNLQEDMENFVRYKLIGGKILLKQDVVPHIFDCQQDRKRAASVPQRTVVLKRQRKQLVEEAITWRIRETETETEKQRNVEQEFLPTVMDFDGPSTSSGQARLERDEYIVENTKAIGKAKSVGIQAKPHVRSKCVSCKIKPDVRHATSLTEKFRTKDVSTSPLKNIRSVKKSHFY
ncbi:uncharacterized protein LOC108914594 [Anoplophora glabripennis]|uniref:uncharacterized protein LOC108914594 n=1 Tax=Anoplophora glabripennis TaxID=217634 RepID=UPI00087465F9|nr:uncharacterized protein LOC108914594 [Anoplophora glabripennis]